MKNYKQDSLFGEIKTEVENEWEGMPEFVSENKKPSQQIIVSFRSYEDVKLFAKRLGIKATPNTNSTWFPSKEIDTGIVYKSTDWNNEK